MILERGARDQTSRMEDHTIPKSPPKPIKIMQIGSIHLTTKPSKSNRLFSYVIYIVSHSNLHFSLFMFTHITATLRLIARNDNGKLQQDGKYSANGIEIHTQ